MQKVYPLLSQNTTEQCPLPHFCVHCKEKLDFFPDTAYFNGMKRKITSNITICCILFLGIILTACQSARSPVSAENSALPRADSRFIGWLEKESVFNAVQEKIKIVSGTQFAWNFSGSKHSKETILGISPVWLQINPSQLARKNQSPLKILGNNTALLKKASVFGVYLYPTKSTSFESLYAMPSDTAHAEDSPISLSMAKETGTASELFTLPKNSVHTAGNILPASLGTGSDFLLALHGVREYPGLFMMLEIPKNLWQILPASDNSKTFAPAELSSQQLAALQKAGLIPNHFYRDFFEGFPKSGFAASNEILGYDGVTRRWVYRYAKTPYTAVLNFYDPSFQTQRLLSASIIEEVGILRQGLVSVSVQDIWGQESMQPSSETISPLTASQPACHVLENINRSVHGYGAWTFCRDPLEPALIKKVQDAETDFAADTLLMPALEQAVLTESNTPLIQAFALLKTYEIEEQSLWHGSPACFVQSPYTSATLAELIMQKSGISEQEISMLQKMQESPVFQENNQKLSKKLRTAQSLHKLFIGFQSLLPGLNMVALQDMLGVLNPQEKYSAFKENIPQTGSLLFGTLTEQVNKKNSAAENLQDIWTFRKNAKISLADIEKIHTVPNPKTFAFSLRTQDGKTVSVGINLSAVPQKITAFGISRYLQPYEIFWLYK